MREPGAAAPEVLEVHEPAATGIRPQQRLRLLAGGPGPAEVELEPEARDRPEAFPEPLARRQPLELRPVVVEVRRQPQRDRACGGGCHALARRLDLGGARAGRQPRKDDVLRAEHTQLLGHRIRLGVEAVEPDVRAADLEPQTAAVLRGLGRGEVGQARELDSREADPGSRDQRAGHALRRQLAQGVQLQGGLRHPAHPTRGSVSSSSA